MSRPDSASAQASPGEGNGVSPGDWLNVFRRLRLDGVIPAPHKGTYIKGTTVKVVGFALASHADYFDGTGIRISVAKIACHCEISYDVAARCVAGLRDQLGVIALVRKGTPSREDNEGHPSEYRLTPLEDWPDHVEVPTPPAYALMVRRLAVANKGRRAPVVRRGTPVDNNGSTADSPVDETDVPLSYAGAQDATAPAKNRGTSACAPVFRSDVPLRTTGATETITETVFTETVDIQDLHTAVTVSRAGPPEDPVFDSERIDPASPADPPDVAPAESPPSRDPTDALTADAEAEWRLAGRTLPVCDHGFPNVLRDDGSHGCVFCRRTLRAAGSPPSVPASLQLVGSAASRVPRGPDETDPDLPPIRTAEGA